MYGDFVISTADPRPMYLQIVEQVKHRVAVGDWSPGDEIPSIRQLAIDLRVSVITVKRAYQELENDGVIVTQHGKGSTIASNPELSTNLYEEEFAAHVREVVRLGGVLGLGPRQIVERVREATVKNSEVEA